MRTGSFYQDDQADLDAAITANERYKADELTAQKAEDEAEEYRRLAEKNKYSMTDVYSAAFERENEITSAIRYSQDMSGIDYTPEEGYDVFNDLDNYAGHAKRFVGVRSRSHAGAIKNIIDREGRNNKILEVHGAGGTAAMMLAGILAPTAMASMAAPVGVAVKATKAGMRISALKTAAKSGAAGLPFNVAGEAILQETQETRTPEETAANIGAGLVLESVLGGLIVRSSPVYKELKAKVEHNLTTVAPPTKTDVEDQLIKDAMGDGVGAEHSRVSVEGSDAPATGESYKRSGMFKGKYNPLRIMVRLTPQGRVLTGTNVQAKAVMQELTDVNAKIEGDYKPTSVESLVRLNQSKVDALSIEFDAAIKASGMPAEDFQIAVNNYMRYGTESPSSEVNQIAKKMRGKWDEIWDRAFEARVPGTFTERMENGVQVIEKIESKDAAHHLTRAFDQAAIRKDLTGFYTSVKKAMLDRVHKVRNEIGMKRAESVRELGGKMGTDPSLIHTLRAGKKKNAYEAQKIDHKMGGLRLKKAHAQKANLPTDKIDVELAKLAKQKDKFKIPLDELKAAELRVKKFKAAQKKYQAMLDKNKIPDDITLESATQDIANKILNMRPGDSGVAVSTSSVKGRTLMVDDEAIDSFLIKDMNELMQRYNRDVGNKALMAERAGDGDVMWEAPIATIRDDYNLRAQTLTMEGKHAEAKKLMKEGKQQVEDLEVVRDRLLGLDSPASYNSSVARNVLSTVRSIRNWNTLTMLGGVAMSSVPELARAVAQYGLRTTLKGQGKILRDMSLSLKKLPKDDLAMLSSASARMSMNNPRVAAISDFTDEPALTGMERYSRHITDTFMTHTGIKHFDTDMRMLSAYAMNNKMTEQLLTGKIDVAEFKHFGFQGEDLEKLRKLVKKYGGKDTDDLYNMRIEKWDDYRIREKMEAGILREANKITTAAGVGDRPLFMSTELGKTMLQYRGFGLASINRILIPLAQGTSSEIIKGVTLPAVTAALMLMTRRAMQGRESVPEEVTSGDFTSPEAAGFFMDVISYAGIAGVAPDVAMTMDKAFDAGIFSSTQFRNRDKWGLILGPTAGTVTAGMGAFNLETGIDARLRSLRKLMPYQNMFYLRSLINQAEKATAQGLGGSGMYVD